MVKIHNFYLRLIFYILSLIPHDLVKKKRRKKERLSKCTGYRSKMNKQLSEKNLIRSFFVPVF